MKKTVVEYITDTLEDIPKQSLQTNKRRLHAFFSEQETIEKRGTHFVFRYAFYSVEKLRRPTKQSLFKEYNMLCSDLKSTPSGEISDMEYKDVVLYGNTSSPVVQERLTEYLERNNSLKIQLSFCDEETSECKTGENIAYAELQKALFYCNSKKYLLLCISVRELIQDIRFYDLLNDYHSLDIEWGNHDILWMGAACGNDACICNVIRNNLKYNNVEILENAYGISLRQLMLFGMKTYGIEDGIEAARAAITVMLFKLEGQLILAHPEYEMGNRLMLDWLDELQDVGVDRQRFPTVDDERPYALSDEETVIMRKLHRQFVTGQRLHKHVRFLYDKGGMYNVYNGNLLYHGCVPVDSNGAFDKLYIDGEFYHGRALLDKCDEKARAAYVDNPYKDDVDFMWFLWGGEKSPLCGRRLKTFEMEYVTDKSMWDEPSNPYYSRYYDKSFCCQILHEFGLYDDDAHIINGHTPVHAIEGENPVRANGKLFVIDGGFCRAMNKKTGIAGYTLIYNSHGLRLKAHTPFTSVEDALINNTDIETSSEVEENDKRRMLVKDTDIGKRLIGEIDDLHKLLENYRRL